MEALRAAHARAREQVWKLAGAPERLTIDLDATLITAHSDKEGAAGTFKGGFGFHPLLAYADETGEALAGELRAGNAGANTAADQIAVAEAALRDGGNAPNADYFARQLPAAEALIARLEG